MTVPHFPTSYFFFAWGVSEIALQVFRRAGGSTVKSDGGSVFILWIGIAASVYGAITVSQRLPQRDFNYSSEVYWIAVALFLLGSILRWWSIVHLGRFFTVDVAIAKDHRVVDDGPYTYVRHPSYSGMLVVAAGLGLLLFNWVAALVLFVPMLAVLLWRIAVEERALRMALGKDYETYMLRTRRLIPFVY